MEGSIVSEGLCCLADVAAKNAKCKECHKIGHFYKVCQSKKRTRRANLAQAVPQNENDTHIDECGLVQPNPPLVGMLKLINHIGTTNGTQGKQAEEEGICRFLVFLYLDKRGGTKLAWVGFSSPGHFRLADGQLP